MHELILTRTHMPELLAADYLVAAVPFYHIDRTIDFHVMIYVMEGAIYVTEGEEDYTIHPGELLFLKAGVHHYGKYRIETGTFWYYAHFHLEQAEATLAGMEWMEENLTGENLHGKVQIPKKLTVTGSQMEAAIRKSIGCLHGETEKERWMANAAFYRFLTEAAFYEVEEGQEPSLADRIGTYLSEHMQKPFRAEEIAAAFFLSYKYLAAVFKKEKGMSMQQYHNQLRMQEACHLLRSTRLSIGEIAFSLGFADALYFSKCFHQTVGCSPKQYRRELEY